MPKYPNVYVKLIGEDGNAFAILARTKLALKRAGVPKVETDKFFEEATSGDYDHLLRTVLAWVNEGANEDEEDEF